MRRSNSAATWQARRRVRAKSVAGPAPKITASDVGIRADAAKALGFALTPSCCEVEISPGRTCPICGEVYR